MPTDINQLVVDVRALAKRIADDQDQQDLRINGLANDGTAAAPNLLKRGTNTEFRTNKQLHRDWVFPDEMAGGCDTTGNSSAGALAANASAFLQASQKVVIGGGLKIRVRGSTFLPATNLQLPDDCSLVAEQGRCFIGAATAANDLFRLGNNGHVEGLSIGALGGLVRTGRGIVALDKNGVRINDNILFGHWRHIDVQASTLNGSVIAYIQDNVMRDATRGAVAYGSAAVFVKNMGSVVISDNVSAPSHDGDPATFNLYVENGNTINIKGNNFTSSGENVIKATSELIGLFSAMNQYDRNGEADSLQVLAEGTGKMSVSSFHQDWFGNAMASGVVVNEGATGHLAGLEFHGCKAAFNGHTLTGTPTFGYGFNFIKCGPIRVLGGQSVGQPSGAGIFAGAGVTSLTVKDFIANDDSIYGPNGIGIHCEAPEYDIQSCDLRGSLLAGSTVGDVNAVKIFKNNKV